MPSPDVSAYRDPTLDDRTAGDLVDAALELAVVRLPGWTPREGQTESVLIEALAQIGEQLIFALNRVPAAVAEVLIKAFGITRDDGAPATVQLAFTVADQLGHVVPAGTRVSVDLGAAVSPILFATSDALVIAPGAAAGIATATADRSGAAPNGTPAGTAAQLIDAVAFVNGVTLATGVAGGRDVEDDADYFARALLAFQNLTSTLVLAAQFERYALARPSVYRARAVDLYDPASGNSPGTDVGHVTLAVLGPAGAVVSPADKAALSAAIAARASAGLSVHIVDVTISVVPVAVTVRRFAATTDAEVVASVTAALQTYLSPDSWEWSGAVRYNELIALVDRAAGVDFVVQVTDPPTDVALAGIANLVTAGAIAVTVQAPA